MKRQITKDIYSYFPKVSQREANIQTKMNFLDLEINESLSKDAHQNCQIQITEIKSCFWNIDIVPN